MVSTSSQIIQRIENAVYHEPYMIPILFKEGKIKAGFLHSRLKRYIPHRIGIEFECFGDFGNQFINENKLDWTNFDKFKSYFGLIDFSQDHSLNRTRRSRSSESSEYLIEKREEVRVSISDYRQLNGLYRIMNEMAKYCVISSDCGIHIHVDLTKHDTRKEKEKAVTWFNKHMSEVESIFPEYKGDYNKRVAKEGKSSYVNLSMKGTVEFRIAPLTFDYEVLIEWIVKCSKLVSRMILECHLDNRIERKSKHVKNQNERLTRSDILGLRNELVDYVNRQIEEEARLAELFNLTDRELSVEIDRLGRALSREYIDWYVNGDVLIMTLPDDMVSQINYRDAIYWYRRGGISEVLRIAQTYDPVMRSTREDPTTTQEPADSRTTSGGISSVRLANATVSANRDSYHTSWYDVSYGDYDMNQIFHLQV